MRKAISIIIYSLLFISIISAQLLPSLHAAESTIVTVDGVGTIIGNDMARARDEALRDAYRMAIEKSGINMSSYTEMVDLVVIKDVVRAEVSGHVESWKIEDEGVRDDGLYYVTIKATVVNTPVKKDDMEALRLLISLMGNPRFIVMIEETNIGKEVPFSTLEATLTEALTDYGYHSIDPKQKKIIEETDDVRRAIGGDTKAAHKLAMRMQADVIIIGSVYTDKLPKSEYFEGTNWVSSKAYSTVRAIIAETGKVLDVISPQKSCTGLTYQDAGIKAIKKCGEAVADDLIRNILQYINVYEGKTIQLLVSGIDYSDYSKLAGNLRDMRKVVNVFPRGWSKDQPAVYDLKTTGNTEDLMARLETLGLEIVRFNMNKIEAKKVGKSWWKW